MKSSFLKYACCCLVSILSFAVIEEIIRRRQTQWYHLSLEDIADTNADDM